MIVITIGKEIFMFKLFCKHNYMLDRFENRFVRGTRSSGIVGIETFKCARCGKETELEVPPVINRKPPLFLNSKEGNVSSTNIYSKSTEADENAMKKEWYILETNGFSEEQMQDLLNQTFSAVAFEKKQSFAISHLTENGVLKLKKYVLPGDESDA